MMVSCIVWSNSPGYRHGMLCGRRIFLAFVVVCFVARGRVLKKDCGSHSMSSRVEVNWDNTSVRSMEDRGGGIQDEIFLCPSEWWK